MNNGPFDNYRFQQKIPDGDNHQRMICTDCGWIHYVNPKIVVGVVASWEGRLLLCRRAIEPRRGFWTIPAGYMEEHESTEQGAIRETYEEAGANVELDGLLAVYSLPRLSQVHLIYRGRLTTPEFASGEESLEVQLMPWDEIPWDQLAFPTNHWALQNYRQVQHQTHFSPFTTPPEALLADPPH